MQSITPELDRWQPPADRGGIVRSDNHNSGDGLNKNTTPQQRVTPLKPLTKKQQNFVQHLVNNPKQSATAAAKATYNVSSDNSASQVATDNLRKPQIHAELAKYETTAEYNLITLADATTRYALEGGRDGAQYAGVSERVNNSILDRLKGKAVQRQQIETRAVTLNIDLTGVASDDTTTT